MTTIGREEQEAAYAGGSAPWPIAPEEWDAAARRVLEQGPYDYIAGGAGSEATIHSNLEAFQAWRLRPHMLRGAATRDLSVSLLGTEMASPVMLAPIGVQSVAHPEAELAVARAAAATRTPMVLSTASSTPMEEVAAALGDTPRWYQLYWVNDREVVQSLVQRAEAAGFTALVVTLDTLTLSWRDRDLRNAYLPFIRGEGVAQFTSDPVFRERLGFDPADNPLAVGAMFVGSFPHLELTWEDFAWLRQVCRLPILVKGVLTAEDALKAREIGLDGVIVSNHGGRQVDGAVAALDALVEVRAAIPRGWPVLMDSGIRRAADVVKALALGADAVLLGRPYMYGLAVAGQEGVERVLRNLGAELDLTMALVGAARVSELDSGFVCPAR